MKKLRYGTVAVLMLGLSLGGFGTAHAGPLCATLALTPGPITGFDSCVVLNQQDTFANIQTALNAVLNPDVALNAAASFTPGPGGGDEFSGDNPAAGFDITVLPNPFQIQFNALPSGTAFVTIKQANDFEIFFVGDLTLPFTLTHQIPQPGFSHFSTVAGVIPEPTTLLLVGSGLVGLAHVARRRKNR
jgi:PEP-CTERM motif